MKLSRAEVARLVQIRQWVGETRKAKQEMRVHPVVGKMLQTIEQRFPGMENDVELPLRQIEWLLNLIERERAR